MPLIPSIVSLFRKSSRLENLFLLSWPGTAIPCLRDILPLNQLMPLWFLCKYVGCLDGSGQKGEEGELACGSMGPLHWSIWNHSPVSTRWALWERPHCWGPTNHGLQRKGGGRECSGSWLQGQMAVVSTGFHHSPAVSSWVYFISPILIFLSCEMTVTVPWHWV